MLLWLVGVVSGILECTQENFFTNKIRQPHTQSDLFAFLRHRSKYRKIAILSENKHNKPSDEVVYVTECSLSSLSIVHKAISSFLFFSSLAQEYRVHPDRVVPECAA